MSFYYELHLCGVPRSLSHSHSHEHLSYLTLIIIRWNRECGSERFSFSPSSHHFPFFLYLSKYLAFPGTSKRLKMAIKFLTETTAFRFDQRYQIFFISSRWRTILMNIGLKISSFSTCQYLSPDQSFPTRKLTFRSRKADTVESSRDPNDRKQI